MGNLISIIYLYDAYTFTTKERFATSSGLTTYDLGSVYGLTSYSKCSYDIHIAMSSKLVQFSGTIQFYNPKPDSSQLFYVTINHTMPELNEDESRNNNSENSTLLVTTNSKYVPLKILSGAISLWTDNIRVSTWYGTDSTTPTYIFLIVPYTIIQCL